MGISNKPITRNTGRTINMNRPRYEPPSSKMVEIIKRKTIINRLTREIIVPMNDV
jgi:hypothetical protein